MPLLMPRLLLPPIAPHGREHLRPPLRSPVRSAPLLSLLLTATLPPRGLLADKMHGGPNDTERHVGDLGNFKANRRGILKVNYKDDRHPAYGPSLFPGGENYVVGRSMVLHENADQLDDGSAYVPAETVKSYTGNSGSRPGCCLIEFPFGFGEDE